MAQNQGVELVTRFPSEPVLLVTQVDKLAQIMSNLLKNAIEASPEDAIVVLGVRRGVVRSGRIGIELYVEDQAGGLPAEVLLNLQRSKTSTKGGDHQGLGLKIAFDLTNELDGALDVRTEPDHGSVFSLFLPQRD